MQCFFFFSFFCFHFKNYGPWFDVAGAGLVSVVLVGLMDAKEDLSMSEWTYQVLICHLSYEYIFQIW